RFRRPRSRTKTNDQLALALMSRAQQIHIQANSSRNPGRQLTEKRIPGVNVSALAILRAQQAALLRLLAGIVRRQQGLEIAIPLPHEIQATFLHPTVKVMCRDRIGEMKDSVVCSENVNRSFLH